MKTSNEWVAYFQNNLKQKRIDWSQPPGIAGDELAAVLSSLQAWQLGETSDGSNLVKASRRYAASISDEWYVTAVELFIKEEQKHGNNLGRYLDLIGEQRIKKNWGDTLFRKIRYINTSMEIWTLTVITVESTAQLFYQSLKEATGCSLLKQICTDILIDEAAHIHFQMERMAIIYNSKSRLWRFFAFYCYSIFYYATIIVVWLAHRKVFRAGGNDFIKYVNKMKFKFNKTIRKLKTKNTKPIPQIVSAEASG